VTDGLKARLRAATPPYVWLVGAFGIATACFVGSALYADAQFAKVVRLSHKVSEEELWQRSRTFSLSLCGVSVLLSAALAFSAIRYGRRYDAVQRERADEMEAFAGRVAHDLRGPLSPAGLALQCVQRTLGEDDPRWKTLERGRRSLLNVEALIDDLLAFARAGAKPDREASSSLQDVAATVVQDLEPQARDEGVRVLVEELPACTLACSHGVLSSILLNLVGNSLKYMPPDVAEKTVRVRGAQKGRQLVHVEVSDTGKGLPVGDTRRLFEPYVRANRVKPGLGLGLATVRRLVEAHGGSVGARARSEDGTGAVFWFEMPVK
jgi:signal transduction histidine kinase